MSLGKKIREYRTKRGLTQSQIATRLQMTEANISSYERDKSIPPSDKLNQLANILGVSVSHLLGDDERDDELQNSLLIELHSWVSKIAEGPYANRYFNESVVSYITRELNELGESNGHKIEPTPYDVIQVCKEVDDYEYTLEMIRITKSAYEKILESRTSIVQPDDEIRMIARKVKNLNPEKRKLINDLLDTMVEVGEKALEEDAD